MTPHRTFDLRRLLPLALLAAGLAPGMAAAQEADEFRFGEVVDVALVNVEVWVTDDAGRPVLGLTPDDFEVREDGETVPIAFFEEIGAGRLTSALARPPAGTPSEPALATPEPPGHWVLYFDQLHLGATRQKRLIEDFEGFLLLSGIPPERVLILRQGRSLAVEANFGSSRAELEAALDRIARDEPAGGQMAAQAKRLAIARLQEFWETLEQLGIPEPCDFYPSRAVPEINRYTQEALERTELTLANLKITASILAGIEGVKTLIYAGDRLETHPGQDLLRFVRELCPGHKDAGRFQIPEGLGEMFRELTRNANANRVTMYTLQTSGLLTSTAGGAEDRGLDTVATLRNVLPPAVRDGERSGLEVLALETGGRAILNRNRFEQALEEISREMSSYYSLAYEPPHGGDGKEHRIAVRVRGGDLNARHRLNYRDKGLSERLVDRLGSAVYLGISSNPLALRLGAGELTEAEGDLYSLRLHLLVPAQNVVFLPTEGAALARLQATVAIRTPGRPDLEVVERTLPVPEPPEGEQTLLDLVVPLELGEGPAVLAVALRDQATNETSFVSTAVEIQPPAAAVQ